MVAMSIVVAIFVPRIRFTMALAFVLGCVMAAVLVALRRRDGNSPSGIDPGAHALLPLEPRDGIGRDASDGAADRAADRRDVPSTVLPGVAAPAPGLAI
jgi:hypothetical protein